MRNTLGPAQRSLWFVSLLGLEDFPVGTIREEEESLHRQHLLVGDDHGNLGDDSNLPVALIVQEKAEMAPIIVLISSNVEVNCELGIRTWTDQNQPPYTPQI